MNSLQINLILQRNHYTKECFKGVYPSNRIRKYSTYPYCMVANSDKEGQRGTHWLGIFVPNPNTVEYFDSFAEPPNAVIKKFLDQFETIVVNSRQVQSIFDNSCAAHVIYFLISRSKGMPFNTIIKRLTLEKPFSDSFVKLYVWNLITSHHQQQ